MRNAGLEEAQLESRLLGEISITSDMQMTPPLRQKDKQLVHRILLKVLQIVMLEANPPKKPFISVVMISYLVSENKFPQKTGLRENLPNICRRICIHTQIFLSSISWRHMAFHSLQSALFPCQYLSKIVDNL